MQNELFEEQKTIIPLEDVFEAYYECRKHKRNKSGALQFELDMENNLIELWNEINSDTWQPRPSTVFVVEKPVKREIFAAAFRDRIVHHLVINRLNPFFEKHFIHDSYSCRVGKGTHFGIRRATHFIRRCSANSTQKAYILKLDLRGYFMSINRVILYKKLCAFMDMFYTHSDREKIKDLCRIIIFNDPVKNCIFHSKRSLWKGLPKDKSLFTAKKNCGLPIGNLTSQIFANFYLNETDHFIKNILRIKNYGRYVDDCIIVHRSSGTLKKLVPVIREYLQKTVRLTLHPKKIYLQDSAHGVRFLGCFIKPHSIVLHHRTVSNFKKSIFRYNKMAQHHKPVKEECAAFISSVNSYLGIMCHYNTFKRRAAILGKAISPLWYKHITPAGGFKKIMRRYATLSAINKKRGCP